MKYVYPAVFSPDEMGGYCIKFPDIQEAFTQSTDLADGIDLASDVLSLVLYHYETEGKQIPAPSSENAIERESTDIVTLIMADTDTTRRRNEGKLIKKTLCIPSWMNERAIAANVNFSQTLQDALKEKLQLVAAD